MQTAVIFGAGNVGRGFIGQVFSEAGFTVVFVDVAEALLAALQRGSYRHLTVDNDGVVERVISPVTAVNSADAVALAEIVTGASIAATCVGARALPLVCRALAPALVARIAAGAGPLNLLLAENLHDAVPLVRGWLQEAATELDDAALAANLGLVATSIGRMIPAPRPELAAADPAAIEVEPYCYLPVDLAAAVGEFPRLPGVVGDPCLEFGFYGDRKLYLHNMGHAMCAYLGRLAGDEYLWQSVARPEVRSIVREAMVESAAALATAYGRPLGGLLDHVDDLLHRFGNRALGDTVDRVGRDPRRKLAAGDRLLGALALCLANGVRPSRISLGIAAGLHWLAAEEGLDEAALIRCLDDQQVTRDPAVRDLLLAQYRSLSAGLDAPAQLALIEQQFRQPAIP